MAILSMANALRKVLAAAVLVSGTWAAPASAETAPLEYQVKASYLYNFMRFVTWPKDAFGSDGKFYLCVVDADRFGTAFDAIAGTRVDSHPIVIRRLEDVERAQGTRCHLLFIPAELPQAALPSATPERGRLTVSEVPGFLENGGMINLIQRDGRIRFQINLQAAQGAGLVLSSRLLGLALQYP
jgi:hypothetical protein